MSFKHKVDSKRSSTKKSALSRGLEFNLSTAYVANLMSQSRCAYSGNAFIAGSRMHRSFERIDNSKGYVMGNVIAVTECYNKARSDFELSDLIVLVCEKEFFKKHRSASFEHSYYQMRQQGALRVISDCRSSINKAKKALEDIHTKNYVSIHTRANRFADLLLRINVQEQTLKNKVEDAKRKMKYTSIAYHAKVSSEQASTKVLRKLIGGMIQFTALNACQKYNICKGFPINKNLK